MEWAFPPPARPKQRASKLCLKRYTRYSGAAPGRPSPVNRISRCQSCPRTHPSSVVVGILVCERIPSEAHIDHALLARNAVMRLPLAHCLSVLRLIRRAIVEVRPVCRRHRGLGLGKEEFPRRHACRADAGADHGPSVVSRVTVEVAAVAVLIRLR